MNAYQDPLRKPLCYAVPDKLAPDQEPCSFCIHRPACVGAVQSSQRLAALRSGTATPTTSFGTYNNRALTPTAMTPQPQPGQLVTVAAQTAMPVTPPPRPAEGSRYTPSSANSVVVYERGPDVLRELGQRAVLSGAAALLDELGRFLRHDGYRLPLFQTQDTPRITRCAKCNADSPETAKFCTGCGRSFGSPA